MQKPQIEESKSLQSSKIEADEDEGDLIEYSAAEAAASGCINELAMCTQY